MGFSVGQKDFLNRGDSIRTKVQLGSKLQREVKQVAVYEYDFAVDGGAISAITLRSLDAEKIPDNAVILGGVVDVITTLTSATDAATVALHVVGANDIVSALAISAGGNIWDAGLHDVVPDITAANAVKTAAVSDVVATIAVEAVTAGKFLVFLEYVISE